MLGRKRKANDKMKSALRTQDKKRKKMIRTKYGQAPLKHAKKGIYSCAYALVTGVLLFLMLVFSYAHKGDINILIGILGLATLVLSWMGLRLGIQGFRERDKNYITSKIGTAANGLFLLSLAAMFIRGLF